MSSRSSTSKKLTKGKLSPKVRKQVAISRTLPRLFFSQRLETIAMLIKGRAPLSMVNALAVKFCADSVHDTLMLNGVHAPHVTDDQMQPGFMAFGVGERL